jgi:hypothetical protein
MHDLQVIKELNSQETKKALAKSLKTKTKKK